MKKPTTIPEYISQAPRGTQKQLRELRSILRKAAPKAKEYVKWNSPVMEGKRIYFAYSAHKEHLNFMPTRTTLVFFKKDLKKFTVGKDTIQFPYDAPLPKALITRIAKFRVKDVEKNEALWMG